MELLTLLGVFAFCVIIGVPVAFALGISAVATYFHVGFSIDIVFQRVLAGINIYSLMAIPFFIFAGELMFHGGIAQRLVRFAQNAVGAVRGGLGIVNVFSSMLFGGISGSAIADISALIAGIIIPPSHNMIIFALATGGAVSISKLFLAGVVPGMLMCVCLAVAAYIIAVKRGYAAEKFPGWTVLGRHSRITNSGNYCWWCSIRCFHRNRIGCIRCALRVRRHANCLSGHHLVKL